MCESIDVKYICEKWARAVKYDDMISLSTWFAGAAYFQPNPYDDLYEELYLLSMVAINRSSFE
jgi:hypothetical protein